MNRQKFIGKLNKKFSLRIHMTLILFATAMAGATASKVMLIIGINNPAIRYPLTVLFAYIVFFIAVKIWLKIIVGSALIQSTSANSSFDIPSDISLPGNISSSTDTFSGGGGSFSGAGASGSFDGPASSASSGGSGSSFSFDFDADGEGIVVILLLILLGLLLAAVLGAGVYLVYNAPAILSEVAFDSFLAITLTGKTKSMQDDDWIGSVLKGTWKQFAAIFAFTTLTGVAIHVFYPGVTKLSELFKIIMDSGILN